MSERRPATTIGELDIHLGNVMDTLSDLKDSSQQMQRTLATLATRDYVDDQVRIVKQSIHESKPSTQLGNLGRAAAGVIAIVAVLGLLYEVSVTLHALRASIPAPATAVSPK